MVVPQSGDSEMRVSSVKWSYGPANEQPKVFGEDVATLVDGKIKILIAIIEPPRYSREPLRIFRTFEDCSVQFMLS